MNELTDYEKLIEGVNQFTSLLYQYYTALKNQGFDNGAALQLTQAYQSEILRFPKPKPGESHE